MPELQGGVTIPPMKMKKWWGIITATVCVVTHPNFKRDGSAFFWPLVFVPGPPSCQNPKLGGGGGGGMCVRTRVTLNLSSEWGNPLKKLPQFKLKIGHCLLDINYLYKWLNHMGIKYINNLWSYQYQAQIMVKSFVLIFSNLAAPNKSQNMFDHMTPLSCHCHMTLPLWLLGYQTIV